MCGLFGGIGNPDQTAIRALAIANQERGEDSLGFFRSDGATCKSAGTPLDLLQRKAFNKFLKRPGWFVAGHTRYKTRGAVTSHNAHPFKYGPIIGSHNGCVTAPQRFNVDSEFLFYRLAACENDYQAAFHDVSGYWGLTWMDGTAFYMQAHDNEIAWARFGDTVYYSSDQKHLRAVFGPCNPSILKNGATLRFTAAGDMQPLAPVRVAADPWKWSRLSENVGSGGGGKSAGNGIGSARFWNDNGDEYRKNPTTGEWEAIPWKTTPAASKGASNGGWNLDGPEVTLDELDGLSLDELDALELQTDRGTGRAIIRRATTDRLDIDEFGQLEMRSDDRYDETCGECQNPHYTVRDNDGTCDDCLYRNWQYSQAAESNAEFREEWRAYVADD